MPPSSNSMDRYCTGAFLLVLFAIAIYQKALWFVPSTGDDLRILSSVSQTHNPLSYFATDWGMQNTYRLADGRIDTRRRTYRPLHSISIWLGYRIYGVSAFPNQLVNLILHTVNCLLLLRVLRRLGLDGFMALLLAMLGLVSLYTASPATWVSDRQTLVVAMAALVLLNHVVDDKGRLRTSLNPWLVTGLTLVAVFFQESGLLIPLMASSFILLGRYTGPRARHLAVCALLFASYIGLRVLLFRSNAFACASEGFVFGTRQYTLLSDLPWYIALWARFENVAKNFLSVFLPIFNPVGRFDTLHELRMNLLWWLPTVVLAVSVTRKRITKVQWFALAMIALNAALHVQVFRYRVEYISQLAFCLYVGASPVWRASYDKLHGVGRRRLAGACCAIIMLVSISQVNHFIHSNWVDRQDEMTKRRLTTTLQNYPINSYLAQRVLARYAPEVDKSSDKVQ